MARRVSHISATLKAIADTVPPEQDGPATALILQLRSLVATPNIVGFAAARKVMDGVRTDDMAATFYVRRKRPLESMRAVEAVPPVLIDSRGRAILTDIVEIGRPRFHVQARRNPISPGFSIGHHAGDPGTLAAIVTAKGERYALSAQHVLSNNDRGAAGDAILFPAVRDGGSATDRIGVLQPFAPLIPGSSFPNRIDAALCRLDDAALARLDPAIPGSSSPLEMTDPSEGMRVRLNGRSSGAIESRVVDPNSYVLFDRDGIEFGFRGVARCARFAKGGDSGALVIDSQSGKAVGLHLGGSVDASFFVPIKAVAKALSFTFTG